MPERRNTHLPQPPMKRLLSTKNISIESLWSYWLKYTGNSIKEIILAGRDEGWYDHSNEIHVLVPFLRSWDTITHFRMNVY